MSKAPKPDPNFRLNIQPYRPLSREMKRQLKATSAAHGKVTLRKISEPLDPALFTPTLISLFPVASPATESSTDDPPAEDDWYDEHNDPSAKVVLASKTGKKFRVSEWYMKRHCGFIADLMSMPTPVKTAGTSSDDNDEMWAEGIYGIHKPPCALHNAEDIPIDTDLTDEELRWAIGTILFSSDTRSDHLNVAALSRLWDFAKWFQCTRVEVRIKGELQTLRILRHQAWPTLILASKHNDANLGAAAIKAFQHQDNVDVPFKRYEKFTAQTIRDLQPEWLAFLLSHRCERSSMSYRQAYEDWSEIASAFSSQFAKTSK